MVAHTLQPVPFLGHNLQFINVKQVSSRKRKKNSIMNTRQKKHQLPITSKPNLFHEQKRAYNHGS